MKAHWRERQALARSTSSNGWSNLSIATKTKSASDSETVYTPLFLCSIKRPCQRLNSLRSRLAIAMVFRIAAIKPGVTKPLREEPQVLVLRQIAGNVAIYVVQQSCTAEFRSLKIFPVSGTCHAKQNVSTRKERFC